MKNTDELGLNLIEADDQVDWAPVNANMETLEAEALAIRAAQAALGQDLGAVGKNARLVWGSYTGDGSYGPDTPTSLELDFFPVLVVIGQGSNLSIMVRDCPNATSTYSKTITLTWGDRGVSWYTSTDVTNAAFNQNSRKGYVYYYVVIGYDPQA